MLFCRSQYEEGIKISAVIKVIATNDVKNPKYFGLNFFICSIKRRNRRIDKTIAPPLEYVNIIAIRFIINNEAAKIFSTNLLEVKIQ